MENFLAPSQILSAQLQPCRGQPGAPWRSLTLVPSSPSSSFSISAWQKDLDLNREQPCETTRSHIRTSQRASIIITSSSSFTHRFWGVGALLQAAVQRACQTAPPLHPDGRVLVPGTVGPFGAGPGHRAWHGGGSEEGPRPIADHQLEEDGRTDRLRHTSTHNKSINQD